MKQFIFAVILACTPLVSSAAVQTIEDSGITYSFSTTSSFSRYTYTPTVSNTVLRVVAVIENQYAGTYTCSDVGVQLYTYQNWPTRTVYDSRQNSCASEEIGSTATHKIILLTFVLEGSTTVDENLPLYWQESMTTVVANRTHDLLLYSNSNLKPLYVPTNGTSIEYAYSPASTLESELQVLDLIATTGNVPVFITNGSDQGTYIPSDLFAVWEYSDCGITSGELVFGCIKNAFKWLLFPSPDLLADVNTAIRNNPEKPQFYLFALANDIADQINPDYTAKGAQSFIDLPIFAPQMPVIRIQSPHDVLPPADSLFTALVYTGFGIQLALMLRILLHKNDNE